MHAQSSPLSQPMGLGNGTPTIKHSLRAKPGPRSPEEPGHRTCDNGQRLTPHLANTEPGSPPLSNVFPVFSCSWSSSLKLFQFSSLLSAVQTPGPGHPCLSHYTLHLLQLTLTYYCDMQFLSAGLLLHPLACGSDGKVLVISRI